MEILGKVISERTADVINSLTSKLDKPVVYHFTDTARTSAFGVCDSSHDDAYHIYSKESLFNLTKAKSFNIAFETNILRQLCRAAQSAEGFPSVITKDTEVTEPNYEFYDALGKLFAVSVFDLNTDLRLKDLGYTSDYFYKHSLNQADKMARKGFQVTNEIDFGRYACQLVSLKLCYPGPEMDALLNLLHEKNAAMVTLINRLSALISSCGYQTADEVLGCLVLLFGTFNLWFTHSIVYQGRQFSSPEEIQSAFPEMKFPSLG